VSSLCIDVTDGDETPGEVMPLAWGLVNPSFAGVVIDLSMLLLLGMLLFSVPAPDAEGASSPETPGGASVVLAAFFYTQYTR